MDKVPLAAAIATALVFGSMSASAAADNAPCEEARIVEERLLGDVGEDGRWRSYQLSTRHIGVGGIVVESLDTSIAQAGIAAATMFEARQAFANALDIDRDVQPGDHFYVRYEQEFTTDGAAVGVGRLIWAELRTKTKGAVAIHRFRIGDQAERLWLANGQSATPHSMHLPLETISISSGFGLRADPFDQLSPLPVTGKAAPKGGPKRNAPLTASPVSNRTGDKSVNLATPLGLRSGLVSHPGTKVRLRAIRHGLVMHEGIDLVASAGTPVYAAADGVVVGAAPNGDYGNWIRIEHAGKLATVYGHLMAFVPGIKSGETVVRGGLIGFVGSTGRSTGPHLHFELQVDGKPVDPVTHLETKSAQLRGPDLERFRKQVARSLEEREREAEVAASIGL